MANKNLEKIKIKTKWDLTLFYKSLKDPQIEKDVAAFGEDCLAFEKKYKDRIDYLTQEDALFDALTDYEKLSEKLQSSKPLMYLHFYRDIESSNTKVEAEINKITTVLTNYDNKIIFFTLNLGKIDKSKQQEFLTSKKLEHFRYYLKNIFDRSKYQLSESEEKILNLKDLTSFNLWVEGSQKLLNKQTIVFKKQEIPLPEAQNMIGMLGTKDRRVIQDLIMKKLESISDFAESEINAVVLDKKINDELRGFSKPYQATILGYQNEEKTVVNLVETVSKNFKISQNFYKLKAKLLKLDHLEYADRAAGIGSKTKELPFESAVEMLRTIFNTIDPKYKTIFESYLTNGQIDAFPQKNKKGGAYCWGNLNMPTMVLLNHVPNLDAVMTMAHEMGHAFHTELSKQSQSPLYAHYTISVAEVASTLFESFVFAEIFETLSEKEKIVALHDRIQDDIQTIFRQIACFNFERELHETIREKGSLPKQDIAKLMNKHMKSYLGPIMNLKEVDGYFFVNWGHIRRFFYVYSYAFGQIISKALYKKYKEDKSFLSKIEQFLSAGSSKSPEDIFKDIGIDISKPEFFELGLKSIEEDINMLKKLTSN